MREISQGNKNRECPPVQMGLENTFSLSKISLEERSNVSEINRSRMIVMTLIIVNGS